MVLCRGETSVACLVQCPGGSSRLVTMQAHRLRWLCCYMGKALLQVLQGIWNLLLKVAGSSCFMETEQSCWWTSASWGGGGLALDGGVGGRSEALYLGALALGRCLLCCCFWESSSSFREGSLQKWKPSHGLVQHTGVGLCPGTPGQDTAFSGYDPKTGCFPIFQGLPSHCSTVSPPPGPWSQVCFESSICQKKMKNLSPLFKLQTSRLTVAALTFPLLGSQAELIATATCDSWQLYTLGRVPQQFFFQSLVSWKEMLIHLHCRAYPDATTKKPSHSAQV